MSTRPTNLDVPEAKDDQPGKYIRRSREQMAQLADSHKPFDYDGWMRTAPSATPEELAETADFLRLRNLERQDAWSAAVALTLDLPLVTHNAAHFQAIPGLQVLTSLD